MFLLDEDEKDLTDLFYQLTSPFHLYFQRVFFKVSTNQKQDLSMATIFSFFIIDRIKTKWGIF
jgi:hypothetical protein